MKNFFKKSSRHSDCYDNLMIPTIFTDELSFLEKVHRLEGCVNHLIHFFNNFWIDKFMECLNSLFVNAVYIQETETLKLTLEGGKTNE